MHYWTQHEIDFLKIIAWNRSRHHITDKFNKHFKLNLTEQVIVGAMKRHKITTGRTGYFQKGNIPTNAGKKVSPEMYAILKKTMFKKGNIPYNHRPVGDERLTEDGYLEVKVADPNVWKLKQRLVWEQHYGEIPEGHVIIFLDNNKNNFDINNLKCISKNEHGYLNANRMRYDDRDYTEAAVNVAKIAVKIKEIEKKRLD